MSESSKYKLVSRSQEDFLRGFFLTPVGLYKLVYNFSGSWPTNLQKNYEIIYIYKKNPNSILIFFITVGWRFAINRKFVNGVGR